MNSRKEFNAHMLQLLHYPRLLIKMFYSTMPRRRRRRRYTEMVCLQHCRTTTIYHKFYYVQLDSRHNNFSISPTIAVIFPFNETFYITSDLLHQYLILISSLTR